MREILRSSLCGVEYAEILAEAILNADDLFYLPVVIRHYILS